LITLYCVKLSMLHRLNYNNSLLAIAIN